VNLFKNLPRTFAAILFMLAFSPTTWLHLHSEVATPKFFHLETIFVLDFFTFACSDAHDRHLATALHIPMLMTLKITCAAIRLQSGGDLRDD
jgi:hypothetical protein